MNYEKNEKFPLGLNVWLVLRAFWLIAAYGVPELWTLWKMRKQPVESLRAHVWHHMRECSKVVLGLLEANGVRFRIIGLERIDQTRQPYVWAFSHASALDIPIAMRIVGQSAVFIMKHSPKKAPVIGWLARRSGQIIVNRERPGETRADVRDGIMSARRSGLIVYVEGTRSLDGQLQPLKPGAAKYAIELGRDIVPVAICTARDVLPAKTLRLRRGRCITICVGHPIPVAGMSPTHDVPKVTEWIRQQLAAMLAAEAIDRQHWG